MMTALQTEMTRTAEDLASSFDALVMLLAESDPRATDQTVALLHWMRTVQARLDSEMKRRGGGRRAGTALPAFALAGD